MLTRRELVTGTAIGALATIATPDTIAAPETITTDTNGALAGTPLQDVDNAALRRIADRMDSMSGGVANLSSALRSNSVAFGFIPKLREVYTLFWRTNGKFPEFVEVGTDVFYDIYDYHVKQRLPIPVNRLNDGRMTITFMYTQLLVRIDQAGTYIGVPFDRQ